MTALAFAYRRAGRVSTRAGGEQPDLSRYATPYHAPVLWSEVVRLLVTDRTGTYLDCTLGGGGHTAALLDALAPQGRVIGIDRDEQALHAAGMRLDESGRARFAGVRGDFRDAALLLERQGISHIHGLLLDLGVSSHQIDRRDRGFGFDQDGPLDMRMDREGELNAEAVVNLYEVDELARLIRRYGEDPRAARIARAIVESRPLASTGHLAAVIREVVPYREAAKTLARVFQAIRIEVNGELDALRAVLATAPSLVRKGGRIAVIAYHSLEDRLAKRFIRFGNAEAEAVRDLYGAIQTPWIEVTRRPLVASEAEIRANPRARSAKLRVAERV
jgi:16S rRNA (cytosine1402-N4)-methyltransferase